MDQTRGARRQVTANSWELIARCADRVRIIEEPILGLIAAYTLVFKESSGEGVVILDAGDLLEQGALGEIASVSYPDVRKCSTNFVPCSSAQSSFWTALWSATSSPSRSLVLGNRYDDVIGSVYLREPYTLELP